MRLSTWMPFAQVVSELTFLWEVTVAEAMARSRTEAALAWRLLMRVLSRR